MEYSVSGIVIAGTGSGSGKTTVTCAIEQALTDRGLKLGTCKCGPDYIDTMFHSRITGNGCVNLDPFFFSPNTLRWLLSRNGIGKDITIVEGVMGYYDGRGMTTEQGSTWEVASITGLPTVLVVDARGAALSILAQIHGFLTFVPDSRIRGVILNGCSAMVYQPLAEEILRRFAGKVRPLGFLPRIPDCALESRHLGLVTAAEVADLTEKLQKLGAQAEKTIDLDDLLALAASAEPIRCEPVLFPHFPERVRIAVAQDKAFCFYYSDNLRALEEMGAELVPFSPLSDTALPADIHGIYLGGGYPELAAQKLSENVTMRSSIRAALEARMPCIAECGGFMYLCETLQGLPMVGWMSGDSHDTGRLVRFGYITLQAEKDNMLCRAGEEIRGHEFHHYDSDDTGHDFTAARPTGKTWPCVHATGTLYAGYPHFHFYANPVFAENFYRACAGYEIQKYNEME